MEVGELTAGSAHEFCNGLATIHGYSRLLVPERLQTEYRPYVDGIRQETVTLREVVDNFLSFARPAEPGVALLVVEQAFARSRRSHTRLAARTPRHPRCCAAVVKPVQETASSGDLHSGHFGHAAIIGRDPS